ncbi:hypothetical protein [Anabaena lutea]|uniref:Uncharacterized protein n=1 Tax=Anabaena lutea FACHB-196 TaxID=2692881 RepID=A0ABR8FF07_9NOST|nr:hypothetical protein [Anabaena lutea]MBD2568281.1 hypothetical protein [Anabaena lutea FACHB-196]
MYNFAATWEQETIVLGASRLPGVNPYLEQPELWHQVRNLPIFDNYIFDKLYQFFLKKMD